MWRLWGLKLSKIIRLLIQLPFACSRCNSLLSHAMGRFDLSDGSSALAWLYLSLAISMKSPKAIVGLGSLNVIPTVVPLGNNMVNLYILSISPSFIAWSAGLFLMLPQVKLSSILSQPETCRAKKSGNKDHTGWKSTSKRKQRKPSPPQHIWL